MGLGMVRASTQRARPCLPSGTLGQAPTTWLGFGSGSSARARDRVRVRVRVSVRVGVGEG